MCFEAQNGVVHFRLRLVAQLKELVDIFRWRGLRVIAKDGQHPRALKRQRVVDVLHKHVPRSGSFQQGRVCIGASRVNELVWQAEVLYANSGAREARVVLTDQIPSGENPECERW